MELEHFKVTCLLCNRAWRVSISVEELDGLIRKAGDELFNMGESITEQALFDCALGKMIPRHPCEPQTKKPDDVISLIVEALEEADSRGERLTVRGFCRYHQGLGGLGRVKLRKVVEQAIAEGKLALEDGENDNGVKVKFIKV